METAMGCVTVKLAPLLATPPTVTTTFPVVAPVGTGATMLVALQLVGVAVVLLNLTVLVPCVVPKFAPVIVTDVPTNPDAGFTLLMLGAAVATVKLVPLLATPPTVTTTFPVVAPVGTGATMLVALQLVGTAAVPLNLTVLVPCVAPKFAPVIVTEVPITPDAGFMVVIAGVEDPPPLLPLPADCTTPAHPAKVKLANARTQATTTCQRVFCEFAAEQIVVTIFSFPRCRGQHGSCGRARTQVDQGYWQSFKGGNWTSGEKEGRCASMTFTVLKGKLGYKVSPWLSISRA